MQTVDADNLDNLDSATGSGAGGSASPDTTSTTKPKKKVNRGRNHGKKGRPSTRRPEHFIAAKRLAMMGLTVPEIAQALEVAQSTIYDWRNGSKHFAEALESGRKIADGDVERSLLDRAKGYSHPEEKIFCHDGEIIRAETVKRYPPDTMAAIWWLKNRRPDEWKDKQEIEHSGSVDLVAGLTAARARAGLPPVEGGAE
jgi:transcriptional regulator with XRE-family HTH domain